MAGGKKDIACKILKISEIRQTRNGEVVACYPDYDDANPQEAKARVRASHLIDTDGQLRESATRGFVEGMEEYRPGPKGWSSIFSVMRDGRELAEKLRRARERARSVRGLCPGTLPFSAPSAEARLVDTRDASQEPR